ncbi:MAG: hypothetical protein WD556_02235 [Actinomycetota bacterium]
MGPEMILLSVQQGGSEGTYKFTCPVCTSDVEKRADRKIVALLVSAGVGVDGQEQRIEEEPTFEPMFDEMDLDDLRGDLPEGPSFQLDDVIDFHFLLEDERYIEDFLEAQRSQR